MKEIVKLSLYETVKTSIFASIVEMKTSRQPVPLRRTPWRKYIV
jgi:hypothetical protein